MRSDKVESMGGGGMRGTTARIQLRLNARARSGSSGMKTTTGQSRATVSKVEARRVAEKAAGPKAQRPGGNKPFKATAPKPNVKVTTKTGNPSKDTVTKPVKRTLSKRSAVIFKKTEPRKAADVRAARDKAQRDRTRSALTIRVNPARPKITPKQGKPTTGKEDTIETRIEKGIEKARSTTKSYSRDPQQNEADRRVAEGLKAERKAPKNPPRVTKPRSPNYPKSTVARFKRQTGGND